jgi:ribulose-bisphosphate carboxylase large chain
MADHVTSLEYAEAPVPLSGDRLKVAYSIFEDATTALHTAQAIRVEQSIEFPAHLLPQNEFWEQVIGRLESFDSLSERHHRAVISYAVETIGSDFVQLLNIVYGNISMFKHVRVEEVSLPDSLLNGFHGPRFGRDGIRRLTGVTGRALICATLKPMGLSTAALAEMARQYALGGSDMIKDDHGLCNQPLSPFKERVQACMEAISEVNAGRGTKTLYAPNVTAPADEVVGRAHFAVEQGAQALLIIPGLVGWDMVRVLSHDPAVQVPIISHPAFSGLYFTSHQQGLSAQVSYALIPRLAGVDAVIFPNYVGRLYSTPEDCRAILEASSAALGRLAPIMPVPGGGITLELIPELNRFYGQDVIYVMGGGLHDPKQSIAQNCADFRQMLSEPPDA